MAVVPRYTTPTVEPENIPQRSISVSTNADMFGAATARGLEKAGQSVKDVGDIGIKLLQSQQTAASLQSSNNFVSDVSELDAQYKALQGGDAVNQRQAYQQKVRDLQTKYTENMSPFEKQHFLESTDRYTFSILNAFSNHAATQQKKWDYDNGSAMITNATSIAGQNAMDVNAVGAQYNQLKKGIDQQAKAVGWSDEEKEARLQAASAKFDESLVKNMGAKDPATTLARLTDDKAFPYLDDSRRAWYISHFETQIRSQITKQGYVGTSPLSDVRGIRNNNPGNLMGSNGFQGEAGVDDKGYAKFDTPENGLRALGIDLANQEKLHGKNTIEQIITKYAPKESNDTESYIKFLSDFTGYSRSEKLNLSDPGTLSKLMKGITTIENKGNPYSDDQISYAANIAAAHLPTTDGLLTMAKGNPMAQFDIAKNAVFLASPEQSAKLIEAATGENKDRMLQAEAAKQQILSPSGDPAKYLYSHNLDLQTSVQDGLSKNPTSLMRAIKEADFAYDAMHQDPTNRPILSKEVAQGIVNRMVDAGPLQTIQGLEQMQHQYGDAFPRVYSDLVRQGKLPLQYQAAMMMDNTVDRMQLMRAYSSDEERGKGQKAGFDIPNEKMKGQEKVKSTIDTMIDMNEGLHQFTASMYRQGAGVNEANFNTVVKQLAYQKYREGASAETAANDAVHSLVGNYDMSLHSARIPLNVANSVKSNAQAFLNNLSDETISKPDWASDLPHYTQSVKANGTWVNNSDDSGLNLLDQAGKFVRDKKGIPVTIPFSWPARGAAAPINFPAPDSGGD